MDVETSLIDAKFEGYSLATKKLATIQVPLQYRPLKPLQPEASLRKSQWDARIHYNCLTGDSYNRSVAYHLSDSYQIIQIKVNLEDFAQPISVRALYSVPPCANRSENVSIQVAGDGLLVYSDGNGCLMFLQAHTSSCELLYECEPVGKQVPLALLCASYDTTEESFQCLVAETIDTIHEEQMGYRISIVEVRNRRPNGSMDIDSGSIGLYHVATELVLSSSVPLYSCFEGPDVLVYIEGAYIVIVEDFDSNSNRKGNAKIEITHNADTRDDNDTSKKDIDKDSIFATVDDILSTKPRPGIGYHGDIVHVKSVQELGMMHKNDRPLDIRFQKATILQQTSREVLWKPSGQDLKSQLEDVKSTTSGMEALNPTMRCVFDGFEECDVMPNTQGSLLLFSGPSKTLLHQICPKSFKYLSHTISSEAGKLAPLLFQNDIHGLLYAPSISLGKIQMKHYHTFEAFGFVQASKQERMCNAFVANGKFAAIGEYKRRVFVYDGKASKDVSCQHIRNQYVIEYGDYDLLGLQAIDDRGLVILTSQSLHYVQIDM